MSYIGKDIIHLQVFLVSSGGNACLPHTTRVLQGGVLLSHEFGTNWVRYLVVRPSALVNLSSPWSRDIPPSSPT